MTMNKYDEPSELSKHCESTGELYEYLRAKARTHNSYKHYGRLDRIANIVNKKELYLSDGSGWNDTVDSANFNSDDRATKSFGTCFSYLQDESVAMWRIYGNHVHSGAMIDFTRKGMNNILQIQTVEVGYFAENNAGFRGMITLNRPDFEIDLVDVVYYNPKTGYVKRSDEGCRLKDRSILEHLGVCKKYYPWNYENECRLIVTVKKELLPEKCSAVKLDISGVSWGKTTDRMYLCPEHKGAVPNGFKPSELQGSVNFGS